ncbi:hypothetical protein BJV77DRAFT_524308 [Russula vinacea]|nr:hypothetical protein BJV77DRAFT_524308 [Russula vinacea]
MMPSCLQTCCSQRRTWQVTQSGSAIRPGAGPVYQPNRFTFNLRGFTCRGDCFHWLVYTVLKPFHNRPVCARGPYFRSYFRSTHRDVSCRGKGNLLIAVVLILVQRSCSCHAWHCMYHFRRSACWPHIRHVRCISRCIVVVGVLDVSWSDHSTSMWHRGSCTSAMAVTPRINQEMGMIVKPIISGHIS